MRAEGAEHPPGARRAVMRAVVVDDEALVVAKPDRPHPAGEARRIRHHVRQRIFGVRNVIEVEKHRAGDMRGFIFRARIATQSGEEPARVDHAQVRRAEMGGKPVGGNERVHPRLLAAPQPKVKEKAWMPGSRKLISNVRSSIAPDWRTSW